MIPNSTQPDTSFPNPLSLVPPMVHCSAVGSGLLPSYSTTSYHGSHYITMVYLDPFKGNGSSLAFCSVSL
jgi:hypothetical protein